jgi:hypothetical protein
MYFFPLTCFRDRCHSSRPVQQPFPSYGKSNQNPRRRRSTRNCGTSSGAARHLFTHPPQPNQSLRSTEPSNHSPLARHDLHARARHIRNADDKAEARAHGPYAQSPASHSNRPAHLNGKPANDKPATGGKRGAPTGSRAALQTDPCPFPQPHLAMDRGQRLRGGGVGWLFVCFTLVVDVV